MTCLSNSVNLPTIEQLKNKFVSLFTIINSKTTTDIFGFSDFIGALALLVVIYTITDYRYKFRIATYQRPLKKLTLIVIFLIGIQSLALEIWKSQNWYVLNISWFSQVEWQIFWAGIFLAVVIIWVKTAFITPPIFSKKNFKQYAQELYRCILRGNEDEMKVIADELPLSAKALTTNSRKSGKNVKEDNLFSGYAHDMLLLIGDRKFCKTIVQFSPGTIISILEPIQENKLYYLPIRQFMLNVTTEAIKNKNSFLYNEHQGAFSGLMGYIQPVSKAMFSSYELLSSLSSSLSPIDISYKEYEYWDSEQLNAYCRIILLILKDFIKKGYAQSLEPSFVYRVFSMHSPFSLHELSKVTAVNEIEAREITQKLDVVCDFVKESVKLLDETENAPTPLKRMTEDKFPKNLYDYIASLITEIIYHSSWVDSSDFVCWHIQHNIIWDLMEPLLHNSKTWKIVHHKVRRLLYDEITRMNSFPNHKSARVLGYCLNVLGLEPHKQKSPYSRFIRLIQLWTRERYLAIREQLPDVAQDVLIGAVSYDEDNNRLVYTAFTKGLNKEHPKQFLALSSIE